MFETHLFEDIRHVDVVPHETSSYAPSVATHRSPTTYGMPDIAAGVGTR